LESVLALAHNNPSFGQRWLLLLYGYEVQDIGILALLLENPVKEAVVLVIAALHHRLEQPSQVVVVWLLIEVNVAASLDVLRKLFGRPAAQLFHCSLTLLLPDSVILIVFVTTGKSLPGQSPFEEVQQNVAN